MAIVETGSIEGFANFIDVFSADSYFSDPHFSRDRGNLYDAFKRNGHRVFATWNDGELSGIFVWLVVPEDSYIELIVGLSRDANAWSEMLDWLENHFPNFQMDFVIDPRNHAARSALSSRGAGFDPEQVWMRWIKPILPDRACRIEAYAPEWREQYRSLHRKDTYWTADRVLEAPDRFRVLIAVWEGRLIGYIDVTHGFEENEPYDLFVLPEYAHMGYEQALLAEAARLNLPKRLTALVDAEDVELYRSAGFETIPGTACVYATYRSPKRNHENEESP